MKRTKSFEKLLGAIIFLGAVGTCAISLTVPSCEVVRDQALEVMEAAMAENPFVSAFIKPEVDVRELSRTLLTRTCRVSIGATAFGITAILRRDTVTIRHRANGVEIWKKGETEKDEMIWKGT